MMKYLLLVLAVSAAVQSSPLEAANQVEVQPRLLDDLISAAVEKVSEKIVELGFDPYHLDAYEASYALPVPVLFNARASVDNVQMTGVSNIVINKVKFSLLTLRLQLDISLPKISVYIGDSALDITLFGSKFNAGLAGSLVITEPRVAGEVRVRLGGSYGITVRKLDLELSLGGLFSQLDVIVQNKNVSPQINNFISVTVPNKLTEYKPEINELVNIVLKDYLDSIL